MQIDIDIRAIALPSDLPALQALWRAAWRDTYGPVLGPGRMHLIDEAVAEPAVSTMFAPDGGGFVALFGTVIVGSVCFAERHGRGYVWGMYVHADRRRQGIGSALLVRAARAMERAGTVELSTTTPASEIFYRRLGFVEVGRSDFELFPGVERPSTSFSADAAALRAAAPFPRGRAMDGDGPAIPR